MEVCPLVQQRADPPFPPALFQKNCLEVEQEELVSDLVSTAKEPKVSNGTGEGRTRRDKPEFEFDSLEGIGSASVQIREPVVTANSASRVVIVGVGSGGRYAPAMRGKRKKNKSGSSRRVFFANEKEREQEMNLPPQLYRKAKREGILVSRSSVSRAGEKSELLTTNQSGKSGTKEERESTILPSHSTKTFLPTRTHCINKYKI